MAKSSVRGGVKLGVQELSTVDLANMLGRAVQVHLLGGLLVRTVIGIDAGQLLGNLPVVSYVVELV